MRLVKYIPVYGAHILKIFTFIILLPLFTRNFSKDTWGLVVSAQAFSFWLQIIVEYGFNLSATRNLVMLEGDNQRFGSYLKEVNLSKLILSLLVILITTLSYLFIHSIYILGSLTTWACIYAIVQGMSPIWYFLAKRKFHIFSSVDFLSRLVYLALCFFFIRNDNSAYLIFLFGIFSSIIPLSFGMTNMYLESRNTPLFWRGVIKTLKGSFSLFLFALITSVYTSLNILILGHFQSLSIVAAYGLADRIVRTASNLFEPINRIFYTNLSRLYRENARSAIIYLRKVAFVLLISGTLVFVLGETLARYIVLIIAPNYLESVEYIRLLFIYLPFLIINNILGLHILLPLGFDKEFNSVFAVVTFISLLAMLFVIPTYGAVGLTIITIITEIFVIFGFLFVIRLQGGLSNMILRGSSDE